MKKRVRLTESDLRRIVKESVRRVMVNELGDTPGGQYMLGRVAGRRYSKESPNDDDYANDVSDYAENAKPDEKYEDFPMSLMFDSGAEDQYAYEKMMQDKVFLHKIIGVYSAYMNDYGYDDMLSEFELAFGE
jgi:hypothetical protein